MIRARHYLLRLISSTVGSLVAIACFGLPVCAQALFVPSPAAPPPLKFISSTERAQLSTAKDAKSRVKTSIQMAETRLLRAEQFTADQRFIAATSELGVYQAIIEDVLSFLGIQKKDSNKTRDMYERLEIQLRMHSTRIEAMRRVTPIAYAVHVKNIWDFSDSARISALNAFFSDMVLPQRADSIQKASDKEPSPTGPVAPPKKQP